MEEFEAFAEDMSRQALTTLSAGEIELAQSVLDEVIAKARAHSECAPLKELAARIGCGIITQFLVDQKLDDACSVWSSVQGLVGMVSDAGTRTQAGQCAFNMFLGHLAAGNMKNAHRCYASLVCWANQTPHCLPLDVHVGRAGLRLITVGLHLQKPENVYHHYIPVRDASERHPQDLTLARCRAKAALFLSMAFTCSKNQDFARTLSAEIHDLVAVNANDPQLSGIKAQIDGLHCA